MTDISKKKKKELLNIFDHMFKCYEYNFINCNLKLPEEGKEAYQQIKKLISSIKT